MTTRWCRLFGPVLIPSGAPTDVATLAFGETWDVRLWMVTNVAPGMGGALEVHVVVGGNAGRIIGRIAPTDDETRWWAESLVIEGPALIQSNIAGSGNGQYLTLFGCRYT